MARLFFQLCSGAQTLFATDKPFAGAVLALLLPT
jgi:hypothetical protein